MKSIQFFKIAGGVVLGLAAIALAAMMNAPRRVQAQDNGNSDEERLVHIGYAIAPVPLNLEGKNPEERRLVGLGSFIVNGQSDCNGCHTAGGAPNFNFASGGNPYFLNQGPTTTDPTVYLAGGTDFFSAVPQVPGVYPPAGYGAYVGPDIFSRNLTPDKNGLPEGGHTLKEFKEIIRTGHDFDKIHPTCLSPEDPNVAAGICIPPPVDGSKLQVMPWPIFQNMTDHQIEAIYEFLSAIPCIDNNFSTPPAGAPNEFRNDCGDPPATRHEAALGRTDARLKTRR